MANCVTEIRIYLTVNARLHSTLSYLGAIPTRFRCSTCTEFPADVYNIDDVDTALYKIKKNVGFQYCRVLELFYLTLEFSKLNFDIFIFRHDRDKNISQSYSTIVNEISMVFESFFSHFYML